MKTLLWLALALATPGLALAQVPSSIDLELQERQLGYYRGGRGMSHVTHFPRPDGGLSVVTFGARVQVGGQTFEPNGEVPSGTLAVRHGPDGAMVSAEAIRVQGHDVDSSQSVALPDGGVLVYGGSRRQEGTVGALARVDAEGRVLWSRQTAFQARRGCNPDERICSFTHFEGAAVAGGRAWVSGISYPGSLTLPGGVTLRFRRGQRMLVELDLATGDARWARRVEGGEAGLLHVGDELVLADVVGGRVALRHFDVDGGRPKSTVRLAVTGAPEMIVRHGDGYAVVVEQPDDTLLVGVDAEGQERFRHAIPEVGLRNAMAGATRLAVSGSTLFFAAPASLEPTSSRGGWRRLVTSIAVGRLDIAGRLLGAPVVHGGQWEAASVGLDVADGAPMLSGVRVEGERYTLRVDRPHWRRPRLAPATALYRTKPGAASSPLAPRR